ncbi:M56 family metallopeptidase [Saccharibacillus alkalitolerans]|uniref:M56 family metallopeptidase n=1 Tax=Saccharibacillus alkalitolerans TaxID=2705290 RepID=A0ABX0F1E2_9BACL|nr:M56 family metallopeptidase [Saccharibacillus alkalitolerans]NGZ74797.1 M56 family metallopeptidase [Saccharibacillus alkalitolerans]
MLNALLNASGSLLGQVLALSAAASAAALIILLLRIPLKNRLHPRWMYVLWGLLLLRLMLPWTPESSFSVYNWLPGGAALSGQSAKEADMSRLTAEEAGEVPNFSPTAGGTFLQKAGTEEAYGGAAAASQAGGGPAGFAESPESAAEDRKPSVSASESPVGERMPDTKAANKDLIVDRLNGEGAAVPEIQVSPLLKGLSVLWLFGIAAVLAAGIGAHMRFTRRLRRDSAAPPLRAELLLRSCLREMRLRRPVALVVTRQVGMPTLLGAVRPRLLLPPEVLTELDESGLRHVLLHELAHVKRFDIAVNMLAAVLTALHWFNPLLIYAFRRMREDQEVACDAMAIGRLEPEERTAYGHTILKLLESSARQVRLPGAAGLSGGRSEIRRRLTMIKKTQARSFRNTVLGAAALLLLGGCTLTGAKSPTEPAETAQQAERTSVSAGVQTTRQGEASRTADGGGAETLLTEENSLRVTSRETSEGAPLYLIYVEIVNGDNGPGRSYLWRAAVDSDRPARADWADVNGDGVKEIVIRLDAGSEASMRLSEIHVLDPYTMEELQVADYLDFEHNRYPADPIRAYGGKVYVNAGLNDRYIARVYDDKGEDWDDILHYWGVARYELVNDRIVAHAYGRGSASETPVELTVTYGTDLKPAASSLYPSGEYAPPFSQKEVRQFMDDWKKTAGWNMTESKGLYRFAPAEDSSPRSGEAAGYAVNPDTGTVFDPVSGAPLHTMVRIGGAEQNTNLSGLQGREYEKRAEQLLQPILTAARLKKNGENWIAGFEGDGYVRANVLRAGEPMTLKADLFTGMWEWIVPQEKQ